MGFLKQQFSNVIEWNESQDDVLFWLWEHSEIKKGSRLILRPGQDAIFFYNGRIEAIFSKEGIYEVESEIIPFLTTLSSFKFGFNTPLRAEVLFVNRKEFLVKWGTKGAIYLPAPGLKGGLPLRSFGTFSIKVQDYLTLIERFSGVREAFRVSDVQERVIAQLDQLLMRWISKEGKDLFNLQANAAEIGAGIQQDLQEELNDLGLAVTDFTISNFNYPERVQEMIEKTASYQMVDDLQHFQAVSLAESLTSPHGNSASVVQSGAGLIMGMELLRQNGSSNPAPVAPTPTQTQVCVACQSVNPLSAKFCSDCGQPIQVKPSKFCPSCGASVQPGAKFCSDCGHHLV